MPRTTIDLDPTVIRELRRRAAREGKSLGRVASETLAAAFVADAPPVHLPLAWTARRMDALVDLEDKEAMRRALERT